MFTQLTAAVTGLSSNGETYEERLFIRAHVSNTTTLRQKLTDRVANWC